MPFTPPVQTSCAYTYLLLTPPAHTCSHLLLTPLAHTSCSHLLLTPPAHTSCSHLCPQELSRLSDPESEDLKGLRMMATPADHAVHNAVNKPLPFVKWLHPYTRTSSALQAQ